MSEQEEQGISAEQVANRLAQKLGRALMQQTIAELEIEKLRAALDEKN